MDEPSIKKSTIFNFPERKIYADYPQLDSIGWEIRTPYMAYYHNCSKVQERQCLFQYTLSGEGALRIGNTTYPIKPGQAFMLEKPGPYIYWVPSEASHWEFLFITFTLESLPFWNKLVDVYGHIAMIPKDSPLLQQWMKIYNLTLHNRMNNFFRSSALAYSFIMELMNALSLQESSMHSQSLVQRCLSEMRQYYGTIEDLEQLAVRLGISQSYLTKVFKLQTGEPPMKYLTRYRLTVACSLLLRLNLSVREIASRVGFQDPNYFSRVFKKMFGATPQEYRRANQFASNEEVHHLDVPV